MRRFLVSLVLVAAASTGVRAESLPPAAPSDARPIFALATNLPLAWVFSFAASGWMVLDEHQAVRVNFARYGRAPVLFPGDGATNTDFGSTIDFGAGWVYYPRRVLDGFTFEGGPLCRIRHTRDPLDGYSTTFNQRNTNTYGGRALFGWTWRPYGMAFISIAVGGSLGYERGTEITFASSVDTMPMHTHVSRADVAAEGYLRFGIAFHEF